MRLDFRPLVDFSELLGDRKLLAVGVGPEGRLASLVGIEYPGEPVPPEQPSFAIRPNAPSTRVTAVVMWDASSRFRELPLQRLRVQYPIVQPLQNGGVLVAASRVAVGGDPNGLVFDSAGALHRRIMLGDGIQHIQVDRDNKAWVGYFDEGVYGNFGWGHPGLPAPIGAPGLNRFDLGTGVLEWSFPESSEWEPIDDCYALNVGPDGIWAYYYGSFDLAKVDAGGSIQRWATAWSGAHAIAVGSGKLLLIGNYQEPLSASLLTIIGTTLSEHTPVVLGRTDGRLPAGAFIGRGDTLYLADGPRWYAASIDDVK